MIKKNIYNLVIKVPFIKKLVEKIEMQGKYPAGHYYSPIPDKNSVCEYLTRQENRKINLIDVDLNDEYQLEVIKRYKDFYKEIPFTFEKNKNRYYFNQDWFSYFDAISLYSFLRDVNPKRVIEVGSGFSSAVILDTVDLFFDTKPYLTFIEPFPDRLNSILRESDKSVEIIIDNVQNVSLDLFKQLKSGDLLFIDSSHVLKYGSDLHYLMFEIIPHLEKGVFVHFHDVIWPFEYFNNWLLEGRYWNEIYLLRSFLAYNSKWKIHFFNSYVSEKFELELQKYMPLALKNPGGSIYIQKIA